MHCACMAKIKVLARLILSGSILSTPFLLLPVKDWAPAEHCKNPHSHVCLKGSQRTVIALGVIKTNLQGRWSNVKTLYTILMFTEGWRLAAGCEDFGLLDSGRTREKGCRSRRGEEVPVRDCAVEGLKKSPWGGGSGEIVQWHLAVFSDREVTWCYHAYSISRSTVELMKCDSLGITFHGWQGVETQFPSFPV